MTTASSSSPVCGDCGRTRRTDRPGDVFMEMAPGKDGKPWHICPGCYNDGRHVRIRKPLEKPVVVSDEFMDALTKTGWTSKDNGDGTNTVSPPERLTNPPRRRRA